MVCSRWVNVAQRIVHGTSSNDTGSTLRFGDVRLCRCSSLWARGRNYGRGLGQSRDFSVDFQVV
jgi:hypothetical protein